MMATLPFNELKAPLLPLTTSCRIANQLNLPTNQTSTKTWKGYSNQERVFPEPSKVICVAVLGRGQFKKAIVKPPK